MRIAVVGAGGQGGVLGGLLARSGEDVALIDRRAHLEAIREGGLTLRTPDGEPLTVRVPATDDPRSLAPRDLVLLCVKTYDLDEALSSARPLVGRSTAVLTVQNGIEAPGAVAEAFGASHVVAGVSYIAARIEVPGTVAFGGVTNRLILGEVDGTRSERLARIVSAFRGAGVDAEGSMRIHEAMWEKLILVCATGGVMAFLRLAWGPVLESRAGRALARAVMEEAEAVARACGVGLPEGAAERAFDFARANIDRSTRSSMFQDLVAGRRLELEALNGAVVRLGRDAGVATPLNSTICSALAPYVDGPPECSVR